MSKTRLVLILSVLCVFILVIFVYRNDYQNFFKGQSKNSMKIHSTVFADGGSIPKRYTCDGKDIFPPMQFLDVSPEALSLTFIIDDPDVSLAGGWDHYVAWNISPDIKEIKEGVKPIAVDGKNSWGEIGYKGPCPPAEHRYYFKLFALDTRLVLQEGASKKQLMKAMEGHILAEAEIMGKYKR